MRKRKTRYYAADFETTVYSGQEYTEVWSAACAELFSDDVYVYHSIGELWDYFRKLECDIICYFHNLKFDGTFWLSYLIDVLSFEQAYVPNSEFEFDVKAIKKMAMENNTFNYVISDRGGWYVIRIKYRDHYIELRDSLKLLPFSLKEIGHAFKTKHQKLEMEYTGFRYAGCDITPEEMEYIKNDVYVLKEALEIMYQQGHTELTIGACCLKEFLAINKSAKEYMPDLVKFEIDPNLYGAKNADDYIRKSYKGGWCYVKKGCENVVYHHGIVYDVNSLYPSQMHSESGSVYPIGYPYFWKGNFIPEWIDDKNYYYFVRIRTRFYLKKDHLPTIQIKGDYHYRATEWLQTSDVLNKVTGKYHSGYYDFEGNYQEARVTLTLTQTDFKLLQDHYYLVDFEILDGCYFMGISGLFDEYIDKYAEIKRNSKGAVRTLAKLYLNNLYGKMASSANSSFKYAIKKEDGSIGFVEVLEFDKKPGYIAIGSAITSYARNFTIRHAQMNYKNFIYADTDSLHLACDKSEVVGIAEDPVKFNHWKNETSWDWAKFVRQKTYVEHVIAEDGIPVEQIKGEDGKPKKPYYSIRCAGMPDASKNLFLQSVDFENTQKYYKAHPEEWEKLSQESKDFLKVKRKIDDFKIGLKVPGKLLPKRIRGGTILVETTYEMR